MSKIQSHSTGQKTIRENSGSITGVANKDVVLITGINGFIGRALCKELAKQYQVVGLDRRRQSPHGSSCITCDLTSPERVMEALQKVKEHYGTRIASVIHLAGYFDFTGEPNPLYDQVNVQGTRHLLNGLQELDVQQFIYASTLLVHAPTDPGVPITEDWPVQPKWVYPESKLETENVIRQEHGDIPCVFLRIAGVYTDQIQPPTLAHQIKWIYEHQLNSHVFPGDVSRGQPFTHIDDLVTAVKKTIKYRTALPSEGSFLIGEPWTMSYEALQNEIGRLVHGETWVTETLPKLFAKAGIALQGHMESVIPDSIDKGEKPFVRPFMVALADDHYEVDISKARRMLKWEPRHSIRDMLPGIIETLVKDPETWYKANKIAPPEWVDTLSKQAEPPDVLLKKFDTEIRTQHHNNLWAHFFGMGLGTWLITSPPILGYEDHAIYYSDMISGVLVFVLSALSLSKHMAWARLANAAVGIWLLFSPLIFWAPNAAAYLTDTLVGALVISLSVLVRPMPGIGIAATTTGPDIPPGWTYSPSTWVQRLPIIILAFIGLYISRYLAAYQLGHIPNAWDPFFGTGTERIITSDVSKAWPVSDAGVGAVTYMLEILTGVIGGRDRWRTMPWLVLLFGIMIVPLGAISIFFIIIQPIVIGTWCTLCLVAAVAMLLQIPYSIDELVATGQFLKERRNSGKSVLLALLRGDTMEGGSKIDDDNFDRSPMSVIKDMLGGGVTLPWPLLASTAIGILLMCTRLIFDTQGAQADSDHLLGALIITVSVTAWAEAARPARFINILFGIALMGAPWMFDGGTLVADLSGVLAGILLVVLSIPRGQIGNQYGAWSRYLV